MLGATDGMPYSANHPEVTLTLRAEDDEIGTRTIILNSCDWSVQIGRGSQTEEHLRPQFNNAWFGSRVMSRAHAEVSVDPVVREVVLTDIGSMHGTYIDGRRLEPNERAVIAQGKVVTLGADILRGEMTYQALQLKISYQWSDEYVARLQQWQNDLKAPSPILDEFRSTPRNPGSLATKNSYSLDYSDDDPMSDHEVEVIYESVVQPQSRKSTQASKVIDITSHSSSVNTEQKDNSVPTSPADEHSTHKIDVPSSQPKDKDIIVIEEQENEVVVLEDAISEPKQSSEPEGSHRSDYNSDSAHNHTEMVDLSSDLDSSAGEDEGYDELGNFSEMESEQDWDDHSAKPVDTAKPQDLENKLPCQKRAGSPSDAAMPKPLSSGPILPSGDVRNRGLPELYAPLASSSSLSMCSYGNGSYPTYPSMTDCGFHHRLPSMQTGPWWDQSMEFGDACAAAPPSYKFAPASFGCRLRTSSPKPAKVSINDILDDEPSNPVVGNKRKRETDGTYESDQVEEVVAYAVEDMSERANSSQAATLYASDTKANDTNSESNEVNSAESIFITPILEPEQPQQFSNEVSTFIDPPNDLGALESQVDSHGDPGKVRPRKRVKLEVTAKSSSSKGKTFVRYAATALVGAAVGSVSTVFGLAALPADYFL